MFLRRSNFVLCYYPNPFNTSSLVCVQVHGITRRIQGRLNDFHLLLATNCQRNSDGTYTQASEQLMDSISASSRLFHALFWASCARRFSVLRTSRYRFVCHDFAVSSDRVDSHFPSSQWTQTDGNERPNDVATIAGK